jgi:nucleotide-binding universal stress UspA family protein
MLPVRTILHATDFSDHSNYAFRLACSLARDYGARLIVLHVAEPPVVIHPEGVVVPFPSDFKDQLWRELQLLQSDKPKVTVEPCLADGEVVPEILRVAGESRCDLILMGTHGRTGLSRLLMGSVAEQVVRKAPCPVLTVKLPRPVSHPAREAVAATADREETAVAR